MIADMGQNSGKRSCIGQQREPFLKIGGSHCNRNFAGIHMKRAGRGAGGGLLFNALALPSPCLFPIHPATPDLSCVEPHPLVASAV